MGVSDFHIAAMAGAGCGKTYSLVENYLCAILGLDQSLMKKRPDEVVALTFTEKAANEMRLRIMKRLQTLVSDPDNDTAIKEIAESFNVNMPPQAELQKLLRALPTAVIATFHSFCSQLLRKEALAFGIDDRFAIMSPKDELFMAKNILRPLIIDEINNNNRHIKGLIARMGLSQNLSSLGLLDGLTDLYLKLFEKNLDCEQLVELTTLDTVTVNDLWSSFIKIDNAQKHFASTNKTEKTRARLDQIATYLHEVSLALDQKNEASIARAFVKLKQAAGGNFGEKVARTMLVFAIAEMGNRLVDYFLQDQNLALAQLLTRFHYAYEKHKKDALVLSYSDLLLKTKEALTNDLLLRQRVKLRVKHILVDEYQDTSPIQQDIIALLAEDRSMTASFSRGKAAIDMMNFNNGASLFVVGDKKQSIYGFRGASVALFDRMIEKMASTHQSTNHFNKRLLVTNRRSNQRIINLVNLVARHTLNNQGYEDDQALIAMPHVPMGSAGLWVLNDDEDLDKTTANSTATVYGIAKLLAERKDLSLKDIVVLVRRIKSASVIKTKLMHFGIEARIIGGDGFFEQQEVADLICMLKLINDPGHHLACGVVFRSPLVMLFDHEIMSCALAHEQSLTLRAMSSFCEQGFLSAKSRYRFETFLQALKEASAVIQTEGLAAAFDVLINTCDAAYAYGAYENCEQIFANIEKLRIMLLFRSKNPYSEIDNLFDELWSDSKEPQAEHGSYDDAVKIMTIHQSKGLEFKVVIVADGESAPVNNLGDFLVDSRFGIKTRPRGRAIAAVLTPDKEDVAPSGYERTRREQKTREEEEIARLLYVALTRAREEVYVATSNTSFTAKNTQHNLVGLFLNAYRNAPEDFLACCDVILLTKPALLKPSNKTTLDEAIEIFSPKTKVVRMFASALSLNAHNKIASLIVKQAKNPYHQVDGDKAHKLLSSICPMLCHDINNEAIDYLINASMRASGLFFPDQDETVLAVTETALSMKSQVKNALRIISELPISFMATPEIMIEGFIDLVVETTDFIGVIEFKSSYKRATDETTYAQVLAYAQALSQNANKPVHYAVVQVGSKKWQWQAYDQNARQIFEQALGDFLGLRG